MLMLGCPPPLFFFDCWSCNEEARPGALSLPVLFV